MLFLYNHFQNAKKQRSAKQMLTEVVQIYVGEITITSSSSKIRESRERSAVKKPPYFTVNLQLSVANKAGK